MTTGAWIQGSSRKDAERSVSEKDSTISLAQITMWNLCGVDVHEHDSRRERGGDNLRSEVEIRLVRISPSPSPGFLVPYEDSADDSSERSMSRRRSTSHGMASRRGLVISVEAMLAVTVSPVTMSMSLGHCQLQPRYCMLLTVSGVCRCIRSSGTTVVVRLHCSARSEVHCRL
jgi:hypothetical protein